MTAAKPRRLEWIPIDDLPEDRKNPKRHQVDGIADSMGRLGVIDLQVIDERTGKLVSGHGRKRALIAARDRGDDPPDGVTVTRSGVWTVPVVRGWRSKNATEAKAALVALNRFTELGGWDDDALADILSELAAGPGLDGVGYTPDDVDALLADLADSEPGSSSAGEDDPGEVIPTCEPGDLWLLGDHRLLVGNAAEDLDAWARLAGDLPTREGTPHDFAGTIP